MHEPDPSSRAADSTRNRLRELFEQLVDLQASERDAVIERCTADADERAALRRLLAADQDAGFLDTPATEHAARMGAEEIASDGLIGQRVGAFRLVRALGHGGMAAVFLGERVDVDYRQQVAVKLLRRGLYSDLEQRLFQRERQVLAALDHPNIAHLIDGGVTDAGIPYLVMEHVDGVALTQYAHLRNLDLDARLRLFLDVCRAVEAAHRSLIVHRDIKPSNILVEADGTVKLLDFGIAKLIEEDEAGATVGVYTPEYAAPEQIAGGAITTATDVYGLGVLLHELLLGFRPAGGATRRPSSRLNQPATGTAQAAEPLRRALRGDLDNIVLKALEPEPLRRYASAGALADDIERHLEHRPVFAHPPSRLYRMAKFVQRHRAGVLATALFAAAILAALGIAVWQARVAREQAARANTVRDFLVDVFDAARAHLPREQRPTPEALVNQARQRLSQVGQLDAATRGDLLRTLGEVSLSLSNFAEAQALFRQAQTSAATLGDVAAAHAAAVLHADALQRAGRNGDAIAEIEPLLPALRMAPAGASLRALGVLAAAEVAGGKLDAALAHRREAAALAAQIYGGGSTEALAAELEVGNTLADEQRYPQAIAALEPALARWRDGRAAEDDRYVAALASLANATDAVGNKPASEARYRELLALKRRIYTAPHDAIARTLRDLGTAVLHEDKFAEAETLMREALTMLQQVYGNDHGQIAETHDALGEAMVAQRRFADADGEYRAAIAICERAALKEEVCPRAHNNLGMSLYRQDRLDEAKAEMTLALEGRRALFGDDHPTVAFSLSTLANVAEKQNDHAQSVRLSGQALAVLERGGRGASREDALIRNGYAQALWQAGRLDDALREIRRTLADWQRVAPDGRTRRVIMLVLQAQILRDLKRADESRRIADEAISIGADPAELAPRTKQLLRELSGRDTLYLDGAAPGS